MFIAFHSTTALFKSHYEMEMNRHSRTDPRRKLRFAQMYGSPISVVILKISWCQCLCTHRTGLSHLHAWPWGWCSFCHKSGLWGLDSSCLASSLSFGALQECANSRVLCVFKSTFLILSASWSWVESSEVFKNEVLVCSSSFSDTSWGNVILQVFGSHMFRFFFSACPNKPLYNLDDMIQMFSCTAWLG